MWVINIAHIASERTWDALFKVAGSLDWLFVCGGVCVKGEIKLIFGNPSTDCDRDY